MAADLVRYFASRLDHALKLLERLVELESHSHDKAGVDRLASFLAAEFGRRGAGAEEVSLLASGNALRAVWPGNGSAPAVLFLGHLDTVWPPGTIRERPFAIRGDLASGPGVFDMKSGILLCLLICDALRERLLRPGCGIRFLLTPDEEIGSAAGLPLIREAAGSCRAVLCLEPPLPGGRVKTFRKGVGSFRLHVTGVAAHAGVDHEKGANAVVELSRQLIRVQGMTRFDHGTTVNVGTVRGGLAVNVVPDHAEAEIDFRFAAPEAGRRLERRILGLRPHDKRCRIAVEGGINRPPLERSDAVVALYGRARGLAQTIGMDLGEGETGGGSDGSFTAAMGIPTLDGLGVEGDGAHAVSEHILISDIPRRAALLGLLAQELAE